MSVMKSGPWLSFFFSFFFFSVPLSFSVLVWGEWGWGGEIFPDTQCTIRTLLVLPPT